MRYDLELDRVVKEVKRSKAKSVLVQLPEGLKPRAKEIADRIKEAGAEPLIWMGSCYGACDVAKADVGLIVQWGHSEWKV